MSELAERLAEAAGMKLHSFDEIFGPLQHSMEEAAQITIQFSILLRTVRRLRKENYLARRVRRAMRYHHRHAERRTRRGAFARGG